MKKAGFPIFLLALILVLSSVTYAQDPVEPKFAYSTPISASNFHGNDSGYVGVDFGFGLYMNKADNIDSHYGMLEKIVFGIGSNEDRIGNEFFLIFYQYNFKDKNNAAGTLYSEMSLVAGYHFIYELMCNGNEIINDKCEIKYGGVQANLFAGIYGAFHIGTYPDYNANVDVAPIFADMGFLLNFPLTEDSMTLDVYAKGGTNFYSFVVDDSITYEHEVRFEGSIGTTLHITPGFRGMCGECMLWRFYVGANMLFTEGKRYSVLVIHAGVNLSW